MKDRFEQLKANVDNPWLSASNGCTGLDFVLWTIRTELLAPRARLSILGLITNCWAHQDTQLRRLRPAWPASGGSPPPYMTDFLWFVIRI